MLIDGFTIIAQVINFIILVFLLKRFLYGPIIRVMDEREKKIALAKDQADIATKDAKQRAGELEEEKKAFLDEKAELLAHAIDDVETWREKKIREAADEINDLRNSWLQKLDLDKRAFLIKLKKEVTHHIFCISEKALMDLADQQIESRIISVFMEKVENELQPFEMKNYVGDVRVTSGFEASRKVVKDVREKFKIWFPLSASIRFETSKDLGMGIELLAGDKKVAWNVDRYLNDLEKEILSGLQSKVRDVA